MFAATGIWLYGNDSATEVGKDLRVPTHVSADIENQITLLYECGVKTPHLPAVGKSIAIEKELIA